MDGAVSDAHQLYGLAGGTGSGHAQDDKDVQVLRGVNVSEVNALSGCQAPARLCLVSWCVTE